MRLHLVFIGKTQLLEMETGIRRYLERLQHYISVNVHIIKAEKITAKGLEDAVRERESERVLKLTGGRGHLVLWDQAGRDLDSVQLAHFLKELVDRGQSEVWMIIGGPVGVSQELRERANTMLSLSRMTLPHDLARLVLAEQLYRAFTILKGEPYHK
jgi:23S rRNA (pseudouridine1915-N3)-methyltransferase